MYNNLKNHLGHRIELAIYGNQNMAIECVDCNEVLIDYNIEGDMSAQ